MFSCLLSAVCLWFQVKDLTRFLDPSGLGVISFEDFHRGICAISNEGTAAHTNTLKACFKSRGGFPLTNVALN